MTLIQSSEIAFRGRHLRCTANRLSVKLAPQAAGDKARGARAVQAALGSDRPFRFVFEFDERGIGVIELQGRADLEATAARIEGHPDILRASPIAMKRVAPFHATTHFPGDPLYPQQWGAPKIRLPEAWGYALQTNVMLHADDVCVAVLDTGLPFAGSPPKPCHEDMEDPRRFVAGGNYVAPGTAPDDDVGHGTHVTGIIAAEHGKRRGTAGVNWRCRVYVAKVFDAAGNGDAMLLYQAVKDAVAFARARGWRLVINFSGSGAQDPLDDDTCDVVTSGGALLVASTGNSAGPVEYPAALSTRPDGRVWYSNVCAVGATDQNDVVAPFSNFGPQVNVTAPGVDIISCVPYPAGGTPRYELMSGTSMAAPFVSGVAALIFAKQPTFAAGHVREQLEITAADLGRPGRDPYYGFGRIDAFRALREM